MTYVKVKTMKQIIKYAKKRLGPFGLYGKKMHYEIGITSAGFIVHKYAMGERRKYELGHVDFDKSGKQIGEAIYLFPELHYVHCED